MDKRGNVGDYLHFVYFIFLLAIISVTIIIGGFSAFGKPYDSRSVDAQLLLSRVVICLENNPGLSTVSLQNIFITCRFDEKTFEKGLVLYLYSGNTEFFKYGDQVSCGLEKKNINYPRCVAQSVLVDVDSKQVEVNIIAGSNLKSHEQNK